MGWLALLAGLAVARPSEALVITVGLPAGAGQCTCATVQCAFDLADDSPAHDEIRVTRSVNAEGTYYDIAAQLTLGADEEVTIDGGYATCTQTEPDGNRAVLSGAAGGGSGNSANAPVLRIRGAQGAGARLIRLKITGGDTPDLAPGGGIDLRGGAFLTLQESEVSGNRAGVGGGIYAEGEGFAGVVRLLQNAHVLDNTGRYGGGGIAANGANVFIEDEGGLVAFNEAPDGNGGGILLQNRGDFENSAGIAGAGAGGLGTVYANSARRGGGIAIVGTEGGDNLGIPLTLTLGAYDGGAPATVRGNAATEAGGGVYVLPYVGLDGVSDAFIRATLEVRDGATLDDNIAPVGSAIYLDHDANGVGSTEGGNLDLEDAFVVGNSSRDAIGELTSGAIVHVGDDAYVRISRTEFRGNAGGPVLRFQSSGRGLDSSNGAYHLLIVDNTSLGPIIETTTDDDPITLWDTTIAGNTLAGPQVLKVSDDITLRRAVIHQPGIPVLGQSGGSRDVAYVVAHETASLSALPGGTLRTVPDPRFFDPERGDYRLHAASPAVDFAPESAPPFGQEESVDLVGAPREVDLAVVGDHFGPRDLGAVERQELLPLVRNQGFADLHRWQANGGTWVASSALADGTGGIYIAATAPVGGRVIGPMQCVPLPARGNYALTGWGREPSATMASADYPRLEWRLFPNSADCSGGPSAEGGVALPSGENWAKGATPAQIAVPNGVWTPNSALLIVAVAVDNNVSGTNLVDAYVDEIVLEHTGDGNLPPVVTTQLLNRTDPEGAAISLETASNFSDPENDDLRYTAHGLPPGVAIDPEGGAIVGVLGFDAAGQHTVFVTARDPFGASVLQSFAWTVTNVNRDPAATDPLGDRSDPEGAVVALDAAAHFTDPDADPLLFLAEGLPPGLAIDPATGLVSGTIGATAATASPYAPTIRVEDGDGAAAEQSFAWTVTAVDAPPLTAATLPDRSDAEGASIAVALAPAFTEPEGEALTYTATNLPPGVALDPSTGLVAGTLAAGGAGDYAVTVSARDPALQAASQSFTWTVTAPPALTELLVDGFEDP